jgi:hypothetical protein
MEIIRCLRLKVWDVESQRMVAVRNIKPAGKKTGRRAEKQSTDPDRIVETNR